ncbi:hypothetical protein SRB5_61850 [Streptomyces sp. RB5]|uniref:Uncharacterized protein n=1 Tax=Streptomyces smaragdinus TaxID=2585196 RepID=A0A7K0CRM3_9ACTN|nr:hypothetical protein [Streptomyces smaragdinus]MQY15993.1 hypothetical protein [Streptomyces smaragdinus]
MGKLLTGAVAVALTVGALVLAYAVDVPTGTVLGIAAGLLSLLWLLVLLTVPWNLYFKAHAVLAEIAVSREKGLTVPEKRDAEAARIARIMLRTAIGGHVLTALLALGITLVTGEEAGYWFAGFFLASTVLRPSGAWFGQLRERLGVLLREARFPRDDVVTLLGQVEDVVRGQKLLEAKAEEQYRTLAELRRTVDALNASVYTRADEADRKIDALAREFESAINRLTSNEEIITGLKAFLRLLRSDEPGTRPPATG